ncbi:hypothetical protein [Epibacterium ulvae]|uniref:hypothetical protein n=1 Tax=Epibacterium ulvae TaxID=1156985 RepID=UPI0024920C9A|nr:hypothetical protein [Epibacterium ulvae]
MKGFDIFWHSINMVLRNLRYVFKLLLLPGLLGGMIFFLFMKNVVAFSAEVSAPVAPSLGLAAGGFGIVIGVWFLILWVVVGWHRFVLLEEYPRFLSRPHVGRIFSYIWHMVGLGLLFALVSLPLMFLILATVSNSPFELMPLLIAIIFVAFFILFRVSVILPAAAIGAPISITTAWSSTKGANGAIFVLLLLSSFANYLVENVFEFLITGSLIGGVFGLVGLIIWSMINVSVITTLYGYYVEGRPIS